MFIAISKQRPLIIVMEDLHWADQISMEMLGRLFDLCEQNPILFINLFRPGYSRLDEMFPVEPDAGGQKNEITIRLTPLSTEHLLEARTLPGSVKSDIRARTGGNPLFIEEVIHSFIEQVAGNMDGLNGRLTELKQLQFIDEQVRFDEKEYVFRHNQKISLTRTARHLFRLFIKLYLPFRQSSKIPTPIENYRFELHRLRGFSVNIINPRRNFFDYIAIPGTLLNYKLTAMWPETGKLPVMRPGLSRSAVPAISSTPAFIWYSRATSSWSRGTLVWWPVLSNAPV